jgi:alpha-galactosidase
VQGGELLHPGEVVLEPGETYTTPEVIAVHSADGLTPATWGFHRSARRSPASPRTPRPVLLNTWEAVYFRHDLDTLRELTVVAADLGVERFVLDDGWFGSRRDDTTGLGDWVVSAQVYPDGLAPLIDHVTGLGMEFGIWVEPEMVNPDSDLYRAHPDWALVTEDYEPVLGRNQLVLDLGRPEAFDHVLGQLDALLADHDISYVKWDMNRDHVQASGATGAPGTRAQTLALYALLDELRRRHPAVEFESCASGGGRIDHEILRRAERVWTSDCNDALERQTIQRGASMLIPPEVMGAHIGPTRAHTTGRVHSLAFRGATALFGHLGVEWNVARIDPDRRAELAAVIELHKRFRPLLHSGDVVRFDTDAAYCAHGVYAADRSAALVSFAQLATAPSIAPPALRLPGLESEARYRVEHVALPDERWGMARTQPVWLTDGVELTGAQLAAHGIRPPAMHPESAVLFTLRRLD